MPGMKPLESLMMVPTTVKVLEMVLEHTMPHLEIMVHHHQVASDQLLLDSMAQEDTVALASTMEDLGSKLLETSAVLPANTWLLKLDLPAEVEAETSIPNPVIIIKLF